MLVVIAIISILASMLSPALMRARDAAYGMACQNSLREMGILLFQYAESYNDRFPSKQIYGNWQKSRYSHFLYPFYANGETCARDADRTSKTPDQNSVPFPLVICPGMSSVCVPTLSSGKYLWIGYKSSMHLGEYIGTGSSPSVVVKRVSQVRTPSKTAFFSESHSRDDGEGQWYVMTEGWWDIKPEREYEHLGKRNSGFVDGHVKAMSGYEFPSRGGKSGAYMPTPLKQYLGYPGN